MPSSDTERKEAISENENAWKLWSPDSPVRGGMVLAAIALFVVSCSGGSHGISQVPTGNAAGHGHRIMPKGVVKAPTGGGVYLGAWADPSQSPADEENEMESLEGSINRTLSLHDQYKSWYHMAQIGSDPGISADVNLLRVPVIAMGGCDNINQASPGSPTSSPLNLVQIANGDADNDLATIKAQLLKWTYSNGESYPIIIRYFWEFNINAEASNFTNSSLQQDDGTNGNGGCFVEPGTSVVTHGGTVTATSLPYQFTNAWNHIVVKLSGITPNVTWAWNPSVEGVDPASYYPDPGNVDWIAFDGYSKLSGGSPKTFDQVFGSLYTTYSSSTYNKPIMIAETASCSAYTLPSQSPDQVGYQSPLPNEFEPVADGGGNVYPDIHALIYFDAPGNYVESNNRCFWSLAASPGPSDAISGLNAFATMGANSYFAPMASHT